MGRQNCTEPSPVGNQFTTTTSCPTNLGKELEAIPRSDETDFFCSDVESGLSGQSILYLLTSPHFEDSGFLNLDLDLDSIPREGSEDTASRLQFYNLDAAIPEARPNAELNTPPNSVGFEHLITASRSPTAVPVPEGSIPWSHDNMGVVDIGSSAERFQITATSSDYGNFMCPGDPSQRESWLTQASTAQASGFVPTTQTEIVLNEQEQTISTKQQKKRLRRGFIQYPSEYVIKGVTFSRNLFAKAYMQQNMVKTTKCLFRALFKDEDLSSKSLSGRKNEKSNHKDGMEMLDKQTLDAISALAWWIDQNKSNGKSPYDINPIEVSALNPPAEEMKEVRRKAFVETRNEMGRKRRQPSEQTAENDNNDPDCISSSSSSPQMKRRNSSVDSK